MRTCISLNIYYDLSTSGAVPEVKIKRYIWLISYTYIIKERAWT